MKELKEKEIMIALNKSV